VTVCPPNSGKWSFLVEGLNKFDTKGLIFDTIRKYNEKDDGKIMRYLFLQSIIGSTKKSKRKVLMDQFDPNLILDHSLPKRLDLLPIEKETFYLLHFACYSAGKRCIQEIIRQVTNVSKNSMDSILANDTREETSEIIQNTLCENQNTNCSIMKKDSWMNCLDLDQKNKSKIGVTTAQICLAAFQSAMKISSFQLFICFILGENTLTRKVSLDS
jgi:hypothetical protein